MGETGWCKNLETVNTWEKAADLFSYLHLNVEFIVGFVDESASFILLCDILYCLGAGFFLAYPAVLNSAILSPNSTDLRATPDQASWIAGSQGVTGLVSFFVMPPIMQVLGRKASHYGINGAVAAGFITFFFASNITCLYIARLFQGLALSGVYITSIILAEYSAPTRRGYFISIKKSAVALGSLSCHWLTVVCTWREIALIGASPNILSIILTIMWPESPAFLAMRGEFEKCDKSHTWLNGNSPESRRQLEELIAAQTERRERKQEGCAFGRVCKSMTKQDFLKPFGIATMLILIVETCGRYYNFAYIVQIMSSIVEDKSLSMYCSLASDFMTYVGLCFSCYAVIKFNRRAILLTCGVCTVLLMFSLSLVVYLRHSNIIGSSLDWLPPSLIVINSFVINLGVIPICFTITGEIFPLEHRGLGTTITGITFTIFYAVVLKCTPLMLDSIGVEGTYGIYGFLTFLIVVILYFILFETKDKTLQEIENELKGNKKCNELLLQ